MKELCEDDYRKILKYIAKKISSIYEKQDPSCLCMFIDCDSVHMLKICSRDETEDDVRQQVLSSHIVHPSIASSCKAFFKAMKDRAKDGYVLSALQRFFEVPAETLLVEADLDVE